MPSAFNAQDYRQVLKRVFRTAQEALAVTFNSDLPASGNEVTTLAAGEVYETAPISTENRAQIDFNIYSDQNGAIAESISIKISFDESV